MLLRFLAAFTLTFFSLAVGAEGISLNQSRIVFPQSEKSQTAQILNDTDKSVLVQATILKDIEGESIDEFIVTPPLFKVEPRKEFLTNSILSVINPEQVIHVVMKFDRENVS